MSTPVIGQTEDGHSFIGGDPSKQENWKAIGAVEDGHVFKGGDPSKAESWASVNMPIQPQTPQASTGEALITGIGKGATLGYLPQIIAGTEPMIQSGLQSLFGDNTDAKLQQQGFTLPQDNSTYTQRRDAQIAYQNQMAQEHPIADFAGQAVGGVGAAVAPGFLAGRLGMAAAAAPATFGGRLLQASRAGAVVGAIRNPGDTQGEVNPLQAKERVRNSATDAATGAVFQGGLEALGKTGSAFKSASSNLSAYAEEKALKALGPIKSKLLELKGKSRAAEIGRSALDEGIVSAGDTIKDIADKAQEVKNNIGENISGIYKQAADLTSSRPFNSPDGVKEKLIEDELLSMAQQIKEASAGKRGASYVADTGNYVNTSTNSTFPDWAKDKGFTKESILSAIESKKGTTYNNLVEIAGENLKRGSFSPVSGDIPPNLEYSALSIPGKISDNIERVFQEEMKNPLLNQAEINNLGNQMNALKAKYSAPSTTINIKQFANDFEKELVDRQQMLPDGDTVINSITKKLQNIAKNGEVDLGKALEIRQQLDKSARKAGAWGSGVDPDVAMELKLLRNKLQDSMKEKLALIDQENGTNLVEQLLKENKRYSNMKEIADISMKKSAGEGVKQTVGITDAALATTGAAAKGGPGAVVALAGSKLSKQYGNPIIANAANKASKILASQPELLGSFAETLQNAASVSPAKFTAAVTLALKDPEFKKAIDSNTNKFQRSGQ